MTKKEELLFSAMQNLTKQQSFKMNYIEKKISRQNRIIREYEKINIELEKECEEFRNIMKQVTKEYNKQLKKFEEK
jgi:phosphoenolpyruvate carboxylase